MRQQRLAAKYLVITFIALAISAHAQTFSVIHTFTGGADGATPMAGLTLDRAGNLYGTTLSGGNGVCGDENDCGTVFRVMKRNSAWIFQLLHAFFGDGDGAFPSGRVIFGPDGALYGVTEDGGGNGCFAGCGTVFKITPSASLVCNSISCPWTETVLYAFSQDSEGKYPIGDLTFDPQGNIYGITMPATVSNTCGLGESSCGTVYQLAPANGGWAHNVLHIFVPIQFSNGSWVPYPAGGVVLDSGGNLYGALGLPAPGNGQVFKLTESSGVWIESVIHSFGENDGASPIGGLILDGAGNLYGTTSIGGANGGGTVFELTTSGSGFNILYNFSGTTGPEDTLLMDGAGNLYGTTYQEGAYGFGSVFELSPSGGGWIYTDLHDFTGGGDGANPQGSVTVDANGTLFGTASGGGTGYGVVWEITP